MLLYNVTVKVNRDIEDEWLQWMKNSHIPAVMNTGKFTSSRICKLIDQPDEDDSTFVIQYSCENRELFDQYIGNFAGALREEHNTRYKNKFVSFKTLMEILPL